ncbi:acyltransferase [candidate division KSB1 bacterium]|nr:acyltransferase [candidate division KSB1 bacterium]
MIMMISSWIPGALGLVLRMKLYPKLLGKCGRNVTFGQNVVLRHPNKIFLGDNVVIDDNCVLDAKGESNQGLFIGNGVFIGRNTILSCKNGDIHLDENVNMGFNCEIFSASNVSLGKNNLIAAYCYIIGGTHHMDRLDVSPLEQERSSAGIVMEDNLWLGAGVKVMDGVRIGRDSVIGTSAVVSKDIPAYSIAVGIPAKVLRSRLDGAANEKSKTTVRATEHAPE